MDSELFLDIKGENTIIGINTDILCPRNLAICNIPIFIHKCGGIF